MTDNVHIVVQEAGAGLVARSFDDIAAAATRAHTATSSLQVAITALGRNTSARTQLQATGAAAMGATGQITALNTAITALNRNGIRQLTPLPGIFNATGQAAGNAANGVGLFFGAFATVGGLVAIVKALKDAQIGFQEIHYGLVAATGSSEAARQEFAYVRQTADTLGLSLQSSAKEYARLAASATAMNVPLSDQHRLYEGLAKASTVLHLSQEKVQFATLALTQMFSKGRIQAEELRRQLGEHIPGVVPRFQKAVEAVVKGTNLAQYSFDDLMKRGLLNTKQFLPQLAQALETTGRGWEKAAVGLNAEINRLSTAWFNLKVEVSDGLFTKALTAGVRFLSGNLSELTAVVMGVGTTLAIAFSPLIIGQFASAMRAAWVIVAANPLAALVAVLAGVTVGLVAARDQMKLFTNDNSTLGDVMSVAWEDFRTTSTFAMDEAAKAMKDMGITTSVTFSGMLDELNGYENKNMSTWLKVARIAAQALDVIAATLRGVFMGMTRVVMTHIDAWANAFGAIGENMGMIMQGDFAGAWANTKKTLSDFTTLGQDSVAAFMGGWNDSIKMQQSGGATALLDDWVSRAKAQAAGRKDAPGVTPTTPEDEDDPAGTKGKKPKKKKKTKTDAEKAAEALKRLQNELLANLANYQRELDLSLGALYLSNDAQRNLQGILDNYKWYENELKQLRDKGYAENSKAYQDQLGELDAHLIKRLDAWRAHEEARFRLTQNVNAGLQKGFVDYFQEISNFNQFSQDAIKRTLSSLEDTFVQFASTGKLSFSSMVDSMIADIARLAIRMGMSGMMNSFTGGGGTTGTLGSLFGGSWGFAKGGAFDGGTPTAFAKGGSFTNGVVTQPTLFSMGGAFEGLGKMGEAGPEAIMPLARTDSGDLGVRMVGGGGGGGYGNITVNNYTSNDKADTDVNVDDMGNVTIDLFDSYEKRLAANMAAGRGPMHRATKQRLKVSDRS